VPVSRVIQVTNPTGLHARPAAQFVELARSFESEIHVELGDAKANAKSMIGLLRLGVAGGSVITLLAEGSDEQAALDGLSALLESLEQPAEEGAG